MAINITSRIILLSFLSTVASLLKLFFLFFFFANMTSLMEREKLGGSSIDYVVGLAELYN